MIRLHSFHTFNGGCFVSSAAVTICFCVLFVLFLVIFAIVLILLSSIERIDESVRALAERVKIPQQQAEGPKEVERISKRSMWENFGGELWDGRPSI